jgi:hypothetical protein
MYFNYDDGKPHDVENSAANNVVDAPKQNVPNPDFLEVSCLNSKSKGF